jgi:hypothetical protein
MTLQKLTVSVYARHSASCGERTIPTGAAAAALDGSISMTGASAPKGARKRAAGIARTRPPLPGTGTGIEGPPEAGGK